MVNRNSSGFLLSSTSFFWKRLPVSPGFCC